MDLKIRTENALLTLMVHAGNLGFRYLRDAIIFVVEDETMIDNMTKKLYPSVAAQNKTTASGVEKAMRHAIERAFVNCEKDRWLQYFPQAMKVPTNSEFIAVLAMRLQRDGDV